ncbi:MAG: hypothetical protein WCW78_02375 [Candidatus Paceibacterota bacterium]|jgi:hypothetical protein
MQLINRILILFLLSMFFFFLQQGGFLRIYGIVPNLILILFLSYVFIGVSRSTLFFFGIVFIVLTLAWVPFWLPEIAVLFLTLFCIILIRRFLTGNPHIDFFISLVGGTFLFYGFLSLFGISLFSFHSIMRELVYSLAVGACIWMGAKRFREQLHQLK